MYTERKYNTCSFIVYIYVYIDVDGEFPELERCAVHKYTINNKCIDNHLLKTIVKHLN